MIVLPSPLEAATEVRGYPQRGLEQERLFGFGRNIGETPVGHQKNLLAGIVRVTL
jgi:hypothetical protein